MRSFFDLVGFEYKKIFKRKGAIIALALVTILTLLLPMTVFMGNVPIGDGIVESAYQVRMKEREYARALSGRSIDEVLIEEVWKAYSKIPPVASNVSFVTIPEYREYAMPYSSIYQILNPVYGSQFRLMQNFSEEQVQNFYQIRHENVANKIATMNISDQSKDILMQSDRQIETPLIFDYIGGYDYFLSMLYTIGVFAAFAIAICLAPVFAGEYSTRTDQLILTSKYGKNKIIKAKLFTGISFCSCICLALTILTYLIGCIILGFDGENAPIQLWYSLAIHPLTMWQVAVIYSICFFFATILVSAVTMVLSSVFKSPFGVIIIICILIFAPMMFNVPDNNILLINLSKLLPTNMMWVWALFVDYHPYELFGLSLKPYVFLPVFAIALSCVLILFSYRSFKNHQVE